MFDRVFYREVRKWFVSLTRFRRYVLFISSVAVPAILGILAAVSGLIPDLRIYIVPAQITVLVFGFVLGFGLFYFEEHVALAFQKFAHETQRTADLQTEIDRQRVEVIQLSAHINCLSVAARAVESALLVAAPVRAGLEEIAKQLLETLADQRAQLFGIREEEQWNFAIYLRDGGQLTCLSHRRNFGQPSDAARSWPVGSGHVGLAYQREGELLNDDVAAEEVFQGKGDLYREYDRARYRGTASICIPDVNDDRPAIGVLVATSSKVGRYSQANVQPLRDLAQSIGAILSPRSDVAETAAGAENDKKS
jgi:plasmid maintenance system killer protein